MTKSHKTEKHQMQFYLIGANFNLLRRGQWNHRDLAARFWRLYHHNSVGGEVVIDGTTHLLVPGYLYVIPPNVHFSTCTKAAVTQFCVHFQIPPFAGLSGEKLHVVKLSPETAGLLGACRTHYENDDIENLRLGGLALAAYCIAQLPVGMLQKKETVDYRIARLCSNLEGLYNEKSDVPWMMKVAGMGSKSTLMRNFRKATGTTPHQFQLKKKYAYAAELLKTTQYTIGEICDMIGIGNQFLFSRYFRKIYGVPPSRYRKKS